MKKNNSPVQTEEKKLLKPKNDVVFQSIFNQNNEKITKAFVEALLDEKITKMTINNDQILVRDAPDDKLGILDLELDINNNEKVDATVVIPEGAIRVRVIANSNTIEDQSMKMKVKKYIEDNLSVLLVDVKDIDEARGIINDNIYSICENSWNFLSFYQGDTLYKVRNKKANLIDLSMLFVNDKKAEKTFETMNTVLNEMNTVDSNKLSSNFVDTYAYFAAGVELPVSNYDYSKSIYTSDRSQLSVGSIYTLSFATEAIKDLSVEKGAATWTVGNALSEVINDRSDIIRLFEGCTISKENTNEPSKVLTK